MAFALFYNPEDFNRILAACQDTSLRGQDRTDALGYYNGGLSTWTTGPLCPANRAGGDPECRIGVCTYKTLADFKALIRRLWQRPGNEMLGGIVLDLDGIGSTEPWPQTTGGEEPPPDATG